MRRIGYWLWGGLLTASALVLLAMFALVAFALFTRGATG